MIRNKQLTSDLIKKSQSIGLDVIGFADPKYFERYPEKNRPEYILEGSNTVVVVGIYLYDLMLDILTIHPITGTHYNFADVIVENKCFLVKEFLATHGYESEIISYFPGLYLKEAAALAGIGPIGKNNLLITERFGSQLRLRALTTIAPLICGNPIEKSKYCEECNICVESCPAKAFSSGKYKRRVCQKYQRANLKEFSEFTTLWCNTGIESCPIYKKKQEI